MPFDPTEVRSRDELLMGAIATGDSTVIGDPRDRNEEFIKAIADGIGSAGGQLYLHKVYGNCTDSDSHTYEISMSFLNRSTETITTKEAIITNIRYLIGTGGISGNPISFIHRLEKVAETVIKLRTLMITQDAGTKLIEGTQRGFAISTVSLTDTVTAL